jgi:hypothetical protein
VFWIKDVLYPGRSVTGPLVTGRFVTGRFVTGCYVTGRFVGVPLHAAVTQTWSCHMVECELPYHALRKCEAFKGVPATDQVERIKRLKLCEGCLTIGHSARARECPYRNENDELCSKKKCGRNHYKLLHAAKGMERGESSDRRGHGSVLPLTSMTPSQRYAVMEQRPEPPYSS